MCVANSFPQDSRGGACSIRCVPALASALQELPYSFTLFLLRGTTLNSDVTQARSSALGQTRSVPPTPAQLAPLLLTQHGAISFIFQIRGHTLRSTTIRDGGIRNLVCTRAFAKTGPPSASSHTASPRREKTF